MTFGSWVLWEMSLPEVRGMVLIPVPINAPEMFKTEQSKASSFFSEESLGGV